MLCVAAFYWTPDSVQGRSFVRASQAKALVVVGGSLHELERSLGAPVSVCGAPVGAFSSTRLFDPPSCQCLYPAIQKCALTVLKSYHSS
jgi:hypothetical protein